MVWWLLAACRGPEAPPPGDPVSFRSALDALLDRDAVRDLRGVVRGASSHDPAGEGDRGRYLRTERHGDHEEHVLLDERGPGVMTRLWSANPERGGTLRIRLDGAQRPWLEAPMAELLAGRGPVPAPLAATAGRGHVSLLPVPYADRLLVTIDRSTGQGLYWEATALRLPEGTPVRSPAAEDLRDPALARVAAALSAPEHEPAPDGVSGPTPLTLTLPPGPGVATLALRVPPERLGDVRLVVETDGGTAIDVFAGALFGLGPRAAPVSTWWASATADGALTSRWPMPYRERMLLRVEAVGAPVEVGISAAVRSEDPGPFVLHGRSRDETMHTRPAPTFALADLAGPGVLVAETLWVDNPVDAWWGQGDETLWVDGVVASRGTGTEDHFGAGWCDHTPFSALLSSQATVDAPGVGDEACKRAAGHAVYHRERLLDAVPFERSLRLELEVVHRAETDLRYRAAAFWYGPPG